MKKWDVRGFSPEKSKDIAKRTDLSRLTAEVMCARGYDDIEALSAFFESEELSDPFLLTDMDKAVEAIYSAVDSGETICIYGDYDCDGVTSTAILYDYLMSMGAEVIVYIPERSEGYGLNMNAVDEIKNSGASLIITVDNGISALREAEYIKELGMKLVITDHHQPSEVLPDALAVVDPYREGCPAPFKHLAGVGVTLKLLCALDDGNYDTVFEQYADICAIGTVADVVPLVSENRTIVKRGLELLKNTENIGLISLMDRSGVDAENITSTSVAFMLSPRINAAGRFGSAMTALDMLTSENGEAEKNAAELDDLNDRRKATELKIMDEISAKISQRPEIIHSRVLVVWGENWHHGVIGIVAARLLEEYERPVVVISIDPDGTACGSARSIKGFNIFKCFEHCRELLVKYGGHECAGGLTLKKDDLEKLDEMIQKYAAKNYPEMPRYTLLADKLLKGSDINEENITDLKRIEPFGAENAEPVFAISGAKIDAVVPLKNGEHTRLDITFDGAKLSALMFKQKTSELGIHNNDLADLMGTLSVNEFRGVKRMSMTVKDFRLHGVRQDRFFAGYDAYESFMRGDILPEDILKKGRPERDELVSVYKYISAAGAPSDYETLYARLQPSGINSFKLRIALDAFADTGLITISGQKGRFALNKPDRRVDIMSSKTLEELDARILASGD